MISTMASSLLDHLLKFASNRIARAFKGFRDTQAVALDISKAFDGFEGLVC